MGYDGVAAPLAHDLWAATAPSPTAVPSGAVALVVAGAHLRGEALEHQVVDAGGRWCGTTRTAPRYALHLVAEDPPRPGLIRTEGPGAAIEVDVWALPPAGWARFVATGVPGLAVGRVEMADGSVLPGFVAAADEAAGRPDLTPHGGWRAWRAAARPADPGGVGRGRAGPVARGHRRIPGRCRADGGRMPVMTTERIEVQRPIPADAGGDLRRR